MTIRWRLGVLLLQLVVLVGLAYVVTGRWIATESWFLAGLLAIVINPSLLEPWYAKPQDVIVNGVVVIGFIYSIEKSAAVYTGWVVLGWIVGFLILLAVVGLILGAGRARGAGVGVGRAVSIVSRVGSAARIYSGVFWLAAVEYAEGINQTLWILVAGWALIMFLGHVNWQAVIASAANKPVPCTPEGMVGPSILFVTGLPLPESGARVNIHDGKEEFSGTILTRIQRASDTWAEVFMETAASCEQLVQASTVAVKKRGEEESPFVGAVDAGSSHRAVEFVAIKPLEVGGVVAVPHELRNILYQISSAHIHRSSITGGAHLVTKARGLQLGEFGPDDLTIRRHAWVPPPGAPVRSSAVELERLAEAPDHWHEMGYVIGTRIPVYLDLRQVCEGHVVILGMTRMGKSSLAVRLANAFSERQRVTLLDQTGEYVGKRGLATWREEHEDQVGFSVWEPKTGDTPAKRALDYLEWLVKKAMEEYRDGEPLGRLVMLEEAHQFVPEPAGLGFGAPGRDSAYQFGTLMMQVRKYGISIALISQRTAVVGKSALSQCENVIAFKSVDKTGLDYLEALVGADARDLLPTLEQGQALVFGPGFSSDGPVAIQVHHSEATEEVP